MASDQMRHFDPLHLLVKARYGSEAAHICDICRTELAGNVGHHCRACNVDLHDECASYFNETISFFAHPCHTLKLSRITGVGWTCDLCSEECPPGSFVYRCAQCLFDVHPVCTLFPQTIRVPQHPEHDFRMVVPSSAASCSACDLSLPVWHYVCPCAARLHVGCASGLVAAACEGDDEPAAAVTQTDASSSCAVGRPRRRRTAIAKFLLKASVRVLVDAATGGLATPVLDILSAVFS